MVRYEVKKLEGLAAHIDGLLNRNSFEIYLANRNQNLPNVAMAMRGIFGENQLTIIFESGDSSLDALFYDLINPENITGRVRHSGGEYECNLIWDDICRNGLGPNQCEEISREARRLILRELEKEDITGEKAFSYLESKALDLNQRWRARRDWVEFLESYARSERLTRDPNYVQHYEGVIGGEKIDIEAVRSKLPNSATPERLYLIAERIMNYELKKVAASTYFSDYYYSDYYIRLDLLEVFDKIGTPEALQRVRERLSDPKEPHIVKEKAARVLQVKI